MMQRKSITLNVDLQPNQIIYWSVQTIDTCLAKSSWSTEQNYSIPVDSTTPTITMNAPADGYNTSNATIVFNATVHDNENVTNVSLWGSWGSWHLNETNSSGINNSDYIFIKNLSGYGDSGYSWHIQACDNSSNCINSSTRAFRIDTTHPTIALLSPSSDSTWSSSNSITFTYNVSDIAVANCSLVIDNTTVENDASITVNTTLSFTRMLSNGNYDWYVNCTDLVGQENSSETRTLAVSYSPPSGNSGNGGGGGTTEPEAQVTHAWDSISAGGTGTAAISREGLSITEVAVRVSEGVSGPRITVRKLDARPSELPAPSGSSYQYVKMTPTKLEESNIKSATVRFRVARSWMTANSIGEDTIALNRYSDGEWVKLATSRAESGASSVTGAVVAGEEGCGLLCQLGRWLGSITGFLVAGDYVYYEAESPGFSYFVITGDREAPGQECNNNGICEVGEAGCPDCMSHELACMPGQRQCSGSLLLECNEDGEAWFIAENCSYVCAAGRCWPGPGDVEGPEEGDPAVWIAIVVLFCLVIGLSINKFHKGI